MIDKQKIRLDVADNGCNLNCKWCHKDYFQNSKKLFDPVFMSKCIEKIMPIYPDKYIEIILGGSGEPLLTDINRLEKFLHLMKTNNKINNIKLITNGTINSNDIFSRLKAAGLLSVNISLSTLSKQKYINMHKKDLLNQVLKTIESAKNFDFEVKINCIYSKCNADEIDDFILLSEKFSILVKFFSIINYPKYYLPLDNLICYLEKNLMEYKEHSNTYAYRAFKKNNAKLIVKLSEINNCPNLNCEKRELCIEGCRSSIRVSRNGILFPCGANIENQIEIERANEEEIVNCLKIGGKL